MLPVAVTEATREAQELLRNPDTFAWSTRIRARFVGGMASLAAAAIALFGPVLGWI